MTEYKNDYKNDFEMLLELFPDILARDPFCVSANPNITWDYVQKHPSFPWSYPGLSMNQNITWDIISAHPDKGWDYDCMITNNPNITAEIILNNLHIEWDYESIIYNMKFVREIIKQIPDVIIDNKKFHSNKEQIISIIEEVVKMKLDSNTSTFLLDLIWEQIKDIPPWKKELSNKELLFFLGKGWEDITWQDILDNPDFNWTEYYPTLCCQKNFTFDIILSNRDKFNDDYMLSMNPNLTWEIVSKAGPEIEWEPGLVSKHPNITWEIIKNNPDYPWDIDCVLENENITWKIAKELIEKHHPQLDYQWFARNEFNYSKNNIRKIKLCQRQVRRWMRKRNRSARIIQRGCHRWLYLGQTNDGKMGINCRIGIKELEHDTRDFLLKN